MGAPTQQISPGVFSLSLFLSTEQRAEAALGMTGVPSRLCAWRPGTRPWRCSRCSGNPQQAAAFEIDRAGIPERSVLQDCHLGKGSMDIGSNDPHLQLLLGCASSGAGGPHDNYGFALAAKRGKVEGAARSQHELSVHRYARPAHLPCSRHPYPGAPRIPDPSAFRNLIGGVAPIHAR